MTEAVKPRAYRSPLRERQAETTRGAILDAAARLFVERGYVRTRLPDVADEADVSLATVKSVFKTKPELLLTVWHRALAGGVDDQVPARDRPWWQAVFETPDPREMLARVAHASTMVRQRVAGILPVIESAAAVDDEIAELQERMGKEFYAHQEAVVERLEVRGQLRADLSLQAATDILWTLNNGRLYTLLVQDRGWTPERYEQWLAGLLQRELLA